MAVVERGACVRDKRIGLDYYLIIYFINKKCVQSLHPRSYGTWTLATTPIGREEEEERLGVTSRWAAAAWAISLSTRALPGYYCKLCWQHSLLLIMLNRLLTTLRLWNCALTKWKCLWSMGHHAAAATVFRIYSSIKATLPPTAIIHWS